MDTERRPMPAMQALDHDVQRWGFLPIPRFFYPVSAVRDCAPPRLAPTRPAPTMAAPIVLPQPSIRPSPRPVTIQPSIARQTPTIARPRPITVTQSPPVTYQDGPWISKIHAVTGQQFFYRPNETPTYPSNIGALVWQATHTWTRGTPPGPNWIYVGNGPNPSVAGLRGLEELPTIMGIPSSYLLIGAAGIGAALLLLKKKKGRGSSPSKIITIG